MKIILANPRGFCAGVDRAIDVVEKAIELYGSPVYVRHEIVHNKYVVEDLKKKGAVFVKEVDEIPEGSITIFSAHGVAEKVVHNAEDRNLKVIDATCPLVTKVHREAQRDERKGREIILIGHAGHPEVEGTSGRVKTGVLLVSSVDDVEKLEVRDPDNVAFVTQTTLSVNDTRDILDALRDRFPLIKGPDLADICYATQNRQDSVKDLAEKVDVILVVGAQNSSNSNRLREYGEKMNTPSYLINSADEIDDNWFLNAEIIGITAGASAPEILVEQIVDHIRNVNGDVEIQEMQGIVETTSFKLPIEVRKKIYQTDT